MEILDKIRAEIKNVKSVFEMNLLIPAYQRPYRWKDKNVRQLLEDININKKSGKQKYRIGSLILCKKIDEDSFDIVDGQQRITTLLLLAKVCGKENDLLDKLQYKHSDSKNGIINNYKYISEWVKEHISSSVDEFWKYVEDNCEFVVIVVDDLSEAFQMFDSQNGRGKELEAYNLLKAYHIRAMEQEPYEVKITCDKRWEAATMYDAIPMGDPNVNVLRQVFNEQLYRGRVWSNGESAQIMRKSDIEEFKGFTIDKNHNIDFPFQNPHLLQYLTAKFYKNILAGTISTQSRFNYGDNENIDPFVSVTQQIVNGKAFFDYVETYVEIYKQLFIQLKSFQLKAFKGFFYKYCLNYGGDLEKADVYCYRAVGYAARTGDGYLREAYKTTIFLLFDKFGEKGLIRYYEILYKLIYLERLVSSQVRRNTVAGLPIPYISIIKQAKNMADLTQLEELWTKQMNDVLGDEEKVKKNVKDVSGIEYIKVLLMGNKNDLTI